MWKKLPSGGFQELDLAAENITLRNLHVSYDTPRMLEFEIDEPQHTLPLGYRDFLIVADKNYKTGDRTNPIFEGWTTAPIPASSRTIKYVAYDATKIAGEEITVFSGPKDSPATFPVEVPRLAYNVRTDSDEDFGYQRRFDATIAEMLQDLLDDVLVSLAELYAAPHRATFPAKKAYDPADLTLDHKPQSKVVFENSDLRTAISNLLQLYPGHKLLFRPGPYQRQWRLVDVKAAPRITHTINDWSAAVKHPVLSLELQRSTERRRTAITLHGPPNPASGVAYQSAPGLGGLDKLWTSAEEALWLGGTIQIGKSYENVGRKWQIRDPARRRLLMLLPDEILVPSTQRHGNNQIWVRSRWPSLQVTFDDLAVPVDQRTWFSVEGIQIDKLDGIVTAPGSVFTVENGARKLPTDVRFLFGYLDQPITLRVPETGHEGTAYTAASLEVEDHKYVDDIIVGYEFAKPVTTAERKDQFKKLAQQYLDVIKDVVYTGGITLAGLDYDDYLDLNRRVNFTAKVDGSLIATGWEAIDAIAYEVQFDLEEALTTVTFSNDHAEYSLLDMSALRELLRIRAMQTIVTQHFILSATAAGITQEFRRAFHHLPIEPEVPLAPIVLE